MAAVDQAVARALGRMRNPLPHHLCKSCNRNRRKPFTGTCPGCGNNHGDPE